MERYQTLGESVEAAKPNYPYQVSLYWPDPPLADPLPILLSEGSGFMSAGGAYKLADMLDDKWTDHLERCNCLYLRDLAREEQRENRVFSGDEIWQKWQNKSS